MSGSGTRIAITGAGAVSPAGWGLGALHRAVKAGEVIPDEAFADVADNSPVPHRRPVPKPERKLPFLREPRLRRSGPVGRFLAAACVEAIGEERSEAFAEPGTRLAVIVSSYSGCVNYSKRFYREVLDDPSTASPILFPETVINAPASHLSALFGSNEANYTLIGDQSQFIAALELGARWLVDDEADAVLVAAAEEADALTGQALALFEGAAITGEGSAALLLERRAQPEVELELVTDAFPISARRSRSDALCRVRDELGAAGGSLFESGLAEPVWREHGGPRFALREICGEGFGAAAAWACATAYAELVSGGAQRAIVCAAGSNQACAGTAFIRNP